MTCLRKLMLRARKPRPFEVGLIILTLLLGSVAMDLLLSAFRSQFVQAFRIPTGSLKPTLLVGDHLMVDKFWTKTHEPQHGDIIVFKYPPNETLDYIQRVIALPNDKVEIREGTVWVNGEAESLRSLEKEYDPQEGRQVLNYEARRANGRQYIIRHYEEHSVAMEDFGPVIVPPNSYFVLGDNRDNAADSRVWGFVPRENIVGKAGLIYWSWDSNTNSVRWSRLGMAVK